MKKKPEPKVPRQESIVAFTPHKSAKHQLKTNSIYCGDNLKMLRELPDESVDLIYIDPPFNSSRNYEAFWGDTQEKRAFNDRFGDAKAYIDYMQPRINEMYRVLKSTGSFYYHCDWHASHYVKVMLDGVFGFNNFKNEIIWQRSDTHNDAKKQFPVVNDSIFLYTKSANYTFNVQYTSYPTKTLKEWYLYLQLPDGSIRKMTKEEIESQLIPAGARRFNSADMSAPMGGGMAAINKKTGRPNGWYIYKGYSPPKNGWRYEFDTMSKLDKEEKLLFPKSKEGRIMFKRFLDEQKGPVLSNLWTDIDQLRAGKKEYIGYPTQKPIPLLERILNASSNKNDVILDAFCGCGSTLISAHKLGRKWIGIDISPTACRVMSQRLWDIFKLDEGKEFSVIDLKKSPEELRKLPHFEFQNWACIALGGIPNKRKSGDLGTDGKLYPIELEKKKKKGADLFGDSDIYYPIQVKQVDKAGRPDIDNFETAIRRDGRNKGYFLAFDFSKDAISEIKRLDKEGDIEIIPIRVTELIKMESFNYA